MIRKPFRPPAFVRPDQNNEPPHKKRRISSQSDASPAHPTPSDRFAATATTRTPLVPAPANSTPNSSVAPGSGDPNERYYTILWRKYTTKKNKTWDGDGVLEVRGGYAVLVDSDTGRELGKGACGRPLLPGSGLSLGGKEVEIEGVLAKEEYFSGRFFLKGAAASVPTDIEKPQSKGTFKNHGATTEKAGKKTGSNGASKKKGKVTGEDEEDEVNIAKPAPNQTNASRKIFKTPVLNSTIVPRTLSTKLQPRHDPSQPNALVMKRPSTCPKGKQIVDVVVDPILSKQLRDHQREGVQFLYECVMGMRCEGEGAIMADEMGLGKTLQTITLLWTLLKQNPIYESQPVVTKALIVCPAGLVDNWRREFRKWLGNERIGVFVVDKSNKDKKITNFTMGKAYNVMIVGYEMLRVVQEDLKKCDGIDIVIADEGHRLKTANNKAMLAIQSLNTERRIILSGTPLQNDLSEFFTAIDFVNPGLLGKRSAFKREFENPIVRSRQPNASEVELEKGEARWKELVSLTGQFMIRRTAEVLSKYLPPKTEHIVFCNPTPAQASAYRAILQSPYFSMALGNTDMALQLITILKKICNSPSLLKSSNTKDSDDNPSEMLQSLLPLIPPQVLNSHSSSTKLRVLDSLVHKVYTTTKEKIVIVSNYTQTLDMIARLLTSLSYTFLRLDGSTPASKRQGLVNQFNNSPKEKHFAFLLSAKSGGVGLNLIGASRIVLFDIDWNPATDLQAMARIHRDGQKLPCKIHRLLVKGGMDEKIYQRQVMKMGLANAVVDNKASAASFSKEELRDLFRLNEGDGCQTHELLGCSCGGTGVGESDLPPPTPESEAGDGAGAGEDEDSDDDTNLLTFRKSSSVNIEHQESALQKSRQKKQPKLRMLMEYAHLDASVVRDAGDDEDMARLVDDDVLLDILKEPDCRVGFLLTKSSS